MVLKTTRLALITAAALAAAAAHAEPLQERLQGSYERIMSKNGIEMAGEINSEYMLSDADGDAVVDTLYSYETTQFTSFDLAMQYRPYDFIWTRADFRFYQDWQTFFATRSRILTSRWLSVDGNLGSMLGFNVGDFRQKYTALTLWTPGLDLPFEPVLFARRRAALMEERYLEGNDRNLQGLNLNFAKRFESPLSEVRLDGMATRLRRAEFLDPNGAHGLGREPSDMDRFLFAANGEAMLMDNLLLGGTFMRTVDDRESFERFIISQKSLDEITAFDPSLLPPDDLSLNGRDSVVARDITVTGAHAGLDLGGFIKNDQLTLDVVVDYAMSSESNKYAWGFRRDTTTKKLVVDEKSAPGTDGKAYYAELGAGWQAADSGWGLRLTGRYMNNEATFLNPAAQSPSFAPGRIFNTENDIYAPGSLYSTFDALNNGVYKFTPSRRALGNQHAPYTKNAYDDAIRAPEDLADFQGDPVVQLVLPFGLATPNRTGATVRLQAHWQNAIHFAFDLAMLEQVEGDIVRTVRANPAKLTQLGAGAKVEIGSLMGRELPLDVTASFARSESKRDPTPEDLANPEITSDLIMAGVQYRLFTKWGVLAGYQQSASKLPNGMVSARSGLAGNQFDMDVTQRHWRVGLEYILTQSAYLMLSGGMNSVEATWVHKGTQPAGAANPALNGKTDFAQTLAQAVINVKF